MTEKQRSALYTVALAITALTTVYGITTKEQAAAWLGLAAAGLATVVAFRHRPTGPRS